MAMMATPLITVDRITVRLRDHWLFEDASWRIEAGQQWAVVGPNGAGKTTLVKAVAGLLPVVRGRIDYPFLDGGAPAAGIAYVTGDARRDLWRRESDLNHGRAFAGRFHDATTVRGLIERALSDRLPASAGLCRLTQVAGDLGLAGLLERPVMTISFGEMSRVLIACELIRDPQMLILDEPFEGLDVPGRREMVGVVNRLAVAGLPIILVTHRAEELLPATTHVLTVDQERITAVQRDGPRAETRESSLAPDRPAAIRPRRADLSARPPAARHAAAKPLIDMQAVRVTYGDRVVLNALNWVVRPGEHWAVTGPNGAGKSTLLKLISGDCLQVYANRIRLFGRRRGTDQSLWEVRQKLGVVSPDTAAAYQKQMSALDVVCSGFFDSVGLYRHCHVGQMQSARSWMAELGIDALAHHAFNQLSQGQRQLILIARAMVKVPTLLILDEPCAGLDPHNRRRVLDLVGRIGRRHGTGLIFVSHHEHEIPDGLTHRLALDQGRVVRCGPVMPSMR
jgi:molybdate transport system ATP-binding protein